jgi:hypothetical protein
MLKVYKCHQGVPIKNKEKEQNRTERAAQKMYASTLSQPESSFGWLIQKEYRHRTSCVLLLPTAHNRNKTKYTEQHTQGHV